MGSPVWPSFSSRSSFRISISRAWVHLQRPRWIFARCNMLQNMPWIEDMSRGEKYATPLCSMRNGFLMEIKKYNTSQSGQIRGAGGCGADDCADKSSPPKNHNKKTTARF